MAEKKEHTIVAASAETEDKVAQHAKAVGNAGTKRLVAVILWVVAFVFEVLAALVLFGKINLKFMPTLWQLIVFLVLDLACVIVGSQFWKKANHIKPASKQNKVKFWLWNNMGVIVCVICFLPIIILFLTNKEIDKKKLLMKEPIRTFGTFEVPVKLHPQVTGTLRVQVIEKN